METIQVTERGDRGTRGGDRAAWSGGAAASAMHVILRIGAGLLFMQHGAQKLFGWLDGSHGESGATVELFSRLGLAGVLEFFGGAMVVVGLFVQPVSLVLVLLMLAAYGIAHLPRGGLPVENGGELALLYALIFAYLAAKGAGPASVDGVRAVRTR